MMPIARDQTLRLKEETSVKVALEPAFNVFHSLTLLVKGEYLYGLNDWVYDTRNRLSETLLWNHRIVFEGLHYAVSPDQSQPSFPDYISHLAASNPLHLRQKMFDVYLRYDHKRSQDGLGFECFAEEPDDLDIETILTDVDAYLNFLTARFGSDHIDIELEKATFELVTNPPAMHRFITAHMWNIWDEVMAKEWRKIKPMLQESVNAFQQVDFRHKSILDAATLILDVDSGDSYEKLKRTAEKTHKITFIPSAHIGPYQCEYGFGKTKWMLFGARAPRGVTAETSELNRAEVLMRMNALTDETRLKILQLIATSGEMSSSEVMTHLGLSQSAASRHLMQLSAIGYLNVSQVQGVKHYSLNPNRIEETLQSITTFLLKR
jgi:ArsR family transcriptional regulator